MEASGQHPAPAALTPSGGGGELRGTH